MLCSLCKTKTPLDYKNARLLQQFVSTFSGRVYEQHITGLCDQQYARLIKTIAISRKAGYMPVFSAMLNWVSRSLLATPVARARNMRELWHGLLKEYPEQFVVGLTFGLGGIAVAIYDVITLPSDMKPWYRGRYDVVRPNSEVAMARRAPEQYPARYLSNRNTESYLRYAKDYGWTAKLD